MEVRVGAEPLDVRRDYRVATNSMLAEGGHNYRAFLVGRGKKEHGGQYEMIKAAIQKRGSVSEGRCRSSDPYFLGRRPRNA
jgi:2',3'-cyclic-nucleotide 2'-phosphodiesterase (5'-nucleotidase family)